MPTKHTVKIYRENGYYHIFNRGVEKRTIFKDSSDYQYFIKSLAQYLTPPELIDQDTVLNNKNYSKDIQLISYCLMPNHFHLQVKQSPSHGINHFMRSLATKYVSYFNKRHDRVGRLFESTYKAVMIETDAQLLQVNKYIHRNPIEMTSLKNLSKYPYSSYSAYLSQVKPMWINTNIVLAYFSRQYKSKDYKSFVEESD